MAFLARGATIDWAISDHPVTYPSAMDVMKARVAAIRQQGAAECIWLLEHPPLLTAGTSARRDELLEPDRFDVFEAGRGGRYTYHGPGQRIAYVMLDLRARGGDVHGLIEKLEGWISGALAHFNITAKTHKDRIGIWVSPPGTTGTAREKKVAAIGLRVSHGVTSHGISLNVEPDLSHFQTIIPCGLNQFGVTSLIDLGLPVTMADVDVALRQSFEELFGPVRRVKPLL